MEKRLCSSSRKSGHAAAPSYDVDFEAKRISGADEEKMIRADEEKMIGADEEKMIGASSTASDRAVPIRPLTTRSRFPAIRGRTATVGGRKFEQDRSGSPVAVTRGREDVERGIAAAAAAEAAAEAAKSAAKSAAEATAAGRVAAADARAEAGTLREKRRAKMLLVKKRLEAFHAEAGER